MTSDIRYAAPGRINLIGEHTDYNQGFALPIALPDRTEVVFRPDGGDVVVVSSDREDGEVAIALDTAPGDVTGWAAYVAGVVWALRGAGHRVGGGAMSVSSGVEMGSGLASSAALECAALGALAAATDLRIGAVERARLAQRAENDYVGAPTGLMDQLASLCGQRQHAMMIDFLDASVRPVPFDPAASGVMLLLINSHAPHRHAGGEYASRRASCERAAAALGVGSLREVQDRGEAALGAISDPVDARRARHILTENRRVADVVTALEHADFAEVGHIFTASHASMRDDFEITTDHIDLIADTCVRAGALGARMTGGGFGGCVIALTHADGWPDVADAVRRAVGDAGLHPPTITPTEAGAGAGAVSQQA
ncbi:galactokinase [Mycolicibacterium sp. 050158]|uniref:galactokinase n=1 Tax=Mycolicibacterium sp. 050158 TaxID=3090602 RepID=UPI00299ECC69|nr:galactokinase [Mycolicibacterium sp. 050158]MDX1888712.1 galactokinase [Mycolicibacterium sp. 050158]